MTVAAKAPKKPTMSLSGVRVAITMGNEGEARKAISRLTGRDASQGLLLLAQFLRKSRRYAPAAQALQDGLAAVQGQGSEDLFVEMADLALHVRNGEEALGHVTQGLSVHHGNRALLIRHAHALVQLGQFGEAGLELLDIAKWEEWTRKEENAIAGAVSSLLPKDHAGVAQVLDAMVAAHPESGVMARHHGTATLRLGRHEDAIRSFRKAVEALPDGGARQASIEGLQKALAAAGLPAEEIPPKGLADPALLTRPFRMAAITNVYNERFNLPIWLNHYGRQVGIENCIVLDNGTDDGSTDNLYGAGKVPMPRGEKYNEAHRMRMITDLANNLLNYYDAVIYSDCDEMVVADPAKHANLTEYAATLTTKVVYSIGLNVRQDITSEGPIDPGRPVLAQRSLVQFVSAMCKPLIIRRPVSWAGGFHSCDHPPVFGDAYLFHLRHADLGQALDRLTTTREIEFAREGAGKHHRRDDFDLTQANYCTTHTTPVSEEFDLSPLTAKHAANMEFMASGRYGIVKTVSAKTLFRIPERFKYIF